MARLLGKKKDTVSSVQDAEMKLVHEDTATKLDLENVVIMHMKMCHDVLIEHLMIPI